MKKSLVGGKFVSFFCRSQNSKSGSTDLKTRRGLTWKKGDLYACIPVLALCRAVRNDELEVADAQILVQSLRIERGDLLA